MGAVWGPAGEGRGCVERVELNELDELDELNESDVWFESSIAQEVKKGKFKTDVSIMKTPTTQSPKKLKNKNPKNQKPTSTS